MKKLILIILIFSAFTFKPKTAHAMDAKGKAFLIMCTYGTVGGALLGFASLSFGTNSRAIAQGASLGLYAGIAFGAYVIATHGKMGQATAADGGGEYYGDDAGYYQDSPEGQGYYQDGQQEQGYGSPPPPKQEESSGGFFGTPQRALEIQSNFIENYKYKKGRKITLPLYINFYNSTF